MPLLGMQLLGRYAQGGPLRVAPCRPPTPAHLCVLDLLPHHQQVLRQIIVLPSLAVRRRVDVWCECVWGGGGRGAGSSGGRVSAQSRAHQPAAHAQTTHDHTMREDARTNRCWAPPHLIGLINDLVVLGGVGGADVSSNRIAARAWVQGEGACVGAACMCVRRDRAGPHPARAPPPPSRAHTSMKHT